MARNRMSDAEIEAAILAGVPTDGSPVTHNDLVESLIQSGNESAVPQILKLAQNKVLVPRVVAQESGKPRLEYVRGENS